MILNVTEGNFAEFQQSGEPMVVDFWAEWCGPCRMVAPVLESLADDYEGRVRFGKVDVDSNNELVSQFCIRSVPTILFFKEGQVVDKVIGYAQRSVLEEKLKALL